MTQWFSAKGYQVVIPVERLKDERMLRLIVRLRSSSGVTFVPLGGSSPMRVIIQALRKNQIVLITADRAVEGESVVRDFFGEPARLPIGPVNLSIRTGAPLVGALGWRVSRKQIRGEFSRLTLALSEEERQQADVVEAALIKQLERAISAHPEQWVVFAPVWTESEQAQTTGAS
jgi:KDO2-lipid IV(A) lauroyltransferase